MDEEDFKRRTKAFAVTIVRFVEGLPKSESFRIFGHQLLRSGTSVGANYRSACRAKSRPDFISKMAIVEEECDESLYWMELFIETGKVKQSALNDLMKEANELLALVVASIRTARISN